MSYIDSGVKTAIYRIHATDTILRLLVDAHETEFTILELVDATDAVRSTVWWAGDSLETTDRFIARVRTQQESLTKLTA